MGGGGNKNPMTGGTTPVQTYDFQGWTPPASGGLTVPPSPVVHAVPTVGGVNTGIPQGGYAAPAIEQYMAGTNAPVLSYNPGQHDAWLGNVGNDTVAGEQILSQRANNLVAIGDGSQPKAEGSHLRQDYYDQQVQTIRDETGWADYDPRVDTIWGSEYQDAYTKSAAAQQAADTLYSNAVGIGSGNSLESGRYSGTTIGDSLHSGLETLGQFSPLLGFVNDKVSDYRAPVDDNRSDDAGPRTSMEIAIDRETQNYANSGKIFDMNDPTTWATGVDDWDDDDEPSSPSTSNNGNTVGSVTPGGQYAGDGFEWVDKGGYYTRTRVGN